MGLLHEHQRPDRDEYIDVDLAAIAQYKGLLSQFRKVGFLEVQSKTLNTHLRVGGVKVVSNL